MRNRPGNGLVRRMLYSPKRRRLRILGWHHVERTAGRCLMPSLRAFYTRFGSCNMAPLCLQVPSNRIDATELDFIADGP
jgi:hypothetical protein